MEKKPKARGVATPFGNKPDKRPVSDRPPAGRLRGCTKRKFCWFMERALEGEDGPGRGMATATRINFRTGKTTSDHVVYRRKGRNKPLMVVRICPFCGADVLGKDP